MLAGAYLAGQFHDEASASRQTRPAALFFRPIINRCLARRREREEHYDASEPFSPTLLESDPRNFQIGRLDVTRTEFRRGRSLWTPFNVGVVELSLFDGSKRRFILVGEQEADDVLNLLRMFDPGIQVTGKARPVRRPPEPMTPAQLRRALIVGVLVLLGFAGFFLYAGMSGRANAGLNLTLAAVNLLVALKCLWSELRKRPDGADEVGASPDPPGVPRPEQAGPGS
jgi:hypothetical protein